MGLVEIVVPRVLALALACAGIPSTAVVQGDHFKVCDRGFYGIIKSRRCR
jgi:hypothetical protein